MTAKAEAGLGENRERSTARTEAPAPSHIARWAAYWSGADARCEEFALTDNPYGRGSTEWHDWNDGWTDHPHKGTESDVRTRE